jgi:hypothetical protein
MSQTILFLLAIASFFLTPMGMLTCGSLASSTSSGESQAHFPGMEAPCEELANAQLLRAVVKIYLSTPFLGAVVTAVAAVFSFILFVFAPVSPPKAVNLKPPTPPPNVS